MIDHIVRVYVTKISEWNSASPPKAESMVGKRLLYYGLNKLTKKAWEDEPIEVSDGGKPYFPNRRDIHFNISHSREYVLCAIAADSLGIDIQYHKTVDLARMAKRMMSEAEYQEFLQAADQQEFFFQKWVEKESYLKWTGDGLRRDMRCLKMTGYPQHIEIAPDYSCALWTKQPVKIEIEDTDFNSLIQDEGI